LLDHFLGSEASLGPVRGRAEALGADADELVKVARCIAFVRARAAAHCLPEYADRRDYLAVLYLTVLSLLPHARRHAAPVANFRLLLALAWVLEETLAALLGLEPFDRQRAPFDPLRLLSPRWLLAAGAPGRVDYLLGTPDGRAALPDVAGLRGVVQNLSHHLDVLDHTLLVLAYLEAILEAPLKSFRDPADLDLRVEQSLRGQGLDRLLRARHDGTPEPPAVGGWGDEDDRRVGGLLERALDERTRIHLKWSALLHDVGKPATRQVTRPPKKAARRGSPNSPERVQFIGHEYYALEALHPLLSQLFAEESDREAVRCLIERHHFANQRLPSPPADEAGAKDWPAPPTPTQVRRWVTEAGGAEDFARLLVHGLADRMARRGPDNKTTLRQELTFYLAALAQAARPVDTGADDRIRGFKKRLQEVLRERRLPRDREGRVREAVVAGAEAILAAVPSGDEQGLTAALEAAVDKELGGR
jgi:hypothetical protein